LERILNGKKTKSTRGWGKGLKKKKSKKNIGKADPVDKGEKGVVIIEYRGHCLMIGGGKRGKLQNKWCAKKGEWGGKTRKKVRRPTNGGRHINNANFKKKKKQTRTRNLGGLGRGPRRGRRFPDQKEKQWMREE